MPKHAALLFAAIAFVSRWAAAESVPFDSPRWKIEAKESRIEEYRGKKALFIKDGAKLRDGVVEFDMAFRLAQGFSGVMFRMEDADDYELFYFRQHLGGKPDANQYTPVIHKLWGWQIYTGPRYCTPLAYPDGEWFHVKLSFSGSRAEVEIGGPDGLVLIPELKRSAIEGALGVFTAKEGARFANFELRPGPVAFRGKEAAPETKPPGVVTAWEVSTPFAEKALDGQLRLPETVTKTLRWTTLPVERNGIANLARLAGVAPGSETVIARIKIPSETATLREMSFGFSDRVKMYLNGRLLYSGNDGFATHDSVFLGSVGLFDSVVLPLQKGENDLSFAVSETFGGWAVIAVLK